MQYKKLSRSVYALRYHVVWVCKYRSGSWPGVNCLSRKNSARGLLRSMPGTIIETIGFDQDHFHMVMKIPPKYNIVTVLAQLKRQSMSQLRKNFAWLSKVYWKEDVIWSPGYFVNSVGADEKTIRRYVEYQGHQDEGGNLCCSDWVSRSHEYTGVPRVYLWVSINIR
jgi:putative transposase